MNQGLTLHELASQIEQNERAKNDFIAPASRLMMDFNSQSQQHTIDFMSMEGHVSTGSYGIRKLAHDQLADRLKIPRAYYRRMQSEAPHLLSENVNQWLKTGSKRHFVRTINGEMRAILSSRYKPIDNYPIAEVLFPIFSEHPTLFFNSAQITESKMYIHVTVTELTAEVKVGEPVSGGVIISNSEIGMGSVDVKPFIYILSCTNGMVRQHALKKYHVGRQIGTDEDRSIEIFSHEAIAADINAFKLKLRDIVNANLNKEKFLQEVELMKVSTGREINIPAMEDVIENVTNRFSLKKDERDGVLTRLLHSKDFTQWGLAQAVTNYANTEEDYDRIVDLETIGGSIVDLNERDWKVLNTKPH